MNKFKQATKKITAVAAAATLVSSTAFSLTDFNNFVDQGVFEGQFVVGSDAAASDTAAAQALIDSLAADYSGNSEKVEIKARKSVSGSEVVSAIKSSSTLNYGESIQNVTEAAGFDDSDVDVLEDGRFNNGVKDEDYEQTLDLMNGAFNYALRDEVDGVDDIQDGIFYDSGEAFATYTLQLDSSVSLASLKTSDFVGEELEIMGNEFTITAISVDGSDNLDNLELIGGAQRIAIGEGDSTSLTVDGTSYEVEVISVGDTEVLLSVNGVSQTIDEYDSEDVAGVEVAVVELQDSDRDSIAGYAQLVIGGQKVELDESGVQINDEDLDDIYPDYEVDVAFSGTGFETITITYKVDDDILLTKGDSLKDILFGSFELVYEGTNEPEYAEFTVTSSTEEIQFSGELENGRNIPSELQLFYDTEKVVGGDLYLGDDDYRIITSDSTLADADVDFTARGFSFDGTSATFNTSVSALDDFLFLLYEDTEDQYLYEVGTVDTSSNEVDFNELLEGNTGSDRDVGVDEWGSELEIAFATTNTSSTVTFNKAVLSDSDIALANEMLLDLSAVEDTFINTSEPTPHIVFKLDSSDVDADEVAEEDDQIAITVEFPTESDDPLELKIKTAGDIVNFASDLADNEASNDDRQTFVTKYGIMVDYDNENFDDITVMVPEEQVEGMVNLVFGSGAAETVTRVVDASAVDEVREQLEADGFTITSTDSVSSEEVEFSVDAPVLDVDADFAAGNHIVVGGPYVNAAARAYLGISGEVTDDVVGVTPGEGVARYFEDANSVLIYGYTAADTTAIVQEVINGKSFE